MIDIFCTVGQWIFYGLVTSIVPVCGFIYDEGKGFRNRQKGTDAVKNSFFVPDYVHELLAMTDKGLKGIAEELARLLSLPVIITDPLFNYFASAQLENNIEIEYIDDQYEENAINKPAVFNCKLISKAGTESGICSAIKLDGRLRGYLFVLMKEMPSGVLTNIYSIITYASTLCSLEMRKKLELKQERQQFKEAFIYDLLYGNMKQRDEIISYGNIWGWDFNQTHTVIVFSLIDFDYYSEDQKLIDSMFFLIEKMIIEKGMKPIAMKKHGEIIVVFQLISTEIENKHTVIEEFVQHVMNLAESLDKNNRIATGIGRESANPEELYKSYQEAKVAFELGVLLNIHTPFFNDMGLERILYKHDLQDLKEYYEHTLGRLEKHDQLHGGELMNTLESYSANQFDLTKTADSLFLHRNTLRYRFKKVEEILDARLDDMNVRLNITAAFKIKQLGKL